MNLSINSNLKNRLKHKIKSILYLLIKYRIEKFVKHRLKEIIFFLNFPTFNTLTPVEKFSQLTAISHFSGPYQLWRTSRINQILELFSIEELSSFRIFEVGGGNCEIGAFFADLGAEVISLEAD